MKKIFCFIFALVIGHGFASEDLEKNWLDHWTSGIISMKKGDYIESINESSKAISLLESTGDIHEHSYVYNSRGQAHLFADHYEDALKDFRQLFENKNGPLTDKIIAQWGITRCYALLGDQENFYKEYALVMEMDPNYPKVEISKDYIIFRNFHSDSPCVKKTFVNALVQMNICDQASDVIFTNNGVCLVKRPTLCGCQKNRAAPNREEEGCKYWCDRVANGAF